MIGNYPGQDMHTYPREPKVPIEQDQQFYEEEVSEYVVPHFLIRVELSELPQMEENVGGLRITGTPASGKHTFLKTLYEEGYIHHLRGRDVDSLIFARSRVTHLYSNQVVPDPTTFGRKIYITNLLMEQYYMARFNNVLAGTSAVDPLNGNEINLFPGEVGGPLMAMVSYTALNSIPEIDPRLLEVLNIYPWSPTTTLHMKVDEVFDHEESPWRSAVLAQLDCVEEIYSNLSSKTDLIQHIVHMSTEGGSVTDRFADLHARALLELEDQLPQPSEELVVDLTHLRIDLSNAMYGTGNLMPLMYMSYLSRDRILIPSLREDREFRSILKNALISYFNSINRVVLGFEPHVGSDTQLDIMSDDWFDRMESYILQQMKMHASSQTGKLFLSSMEVKLFQNQRMKFWASVLRDSRR